MAACLMVTAPCAAIAVGDPGSRQGSHRTNDGSSKRGAESANPRGSGSDYSDDNINNGANSGSGTRPSSRVGSGRETGTSQERPSNDFSPSAGGQTPSTGGQIKAPKVTFGDGRSPGIQTRDPGPRWGWSAPKPAPPPPPPPQIVTVPLTPPTAPPAPPHHPGVVEQLVVSPTAGIADPLWGVAGLLLIPVAGAVLGYRQARGAHAAAELSRHT
ncbi:hypothetical protein [Mycobacterium sp. ACS1612]|uniref:hypothetical protein n=1 Tax=Mycobacterium sp. ACS1612 TaxID=1834117 RepID=UPI0012E9DAEA|nr:hypothetical protein [Mycobacterium sp. ACS1612]